MKNNALFFYITAIVFAIYGAIEGGLIWFVFGGLLGVIGVVIQFLNRN